MNGRGPAGAAGLWRPTSPCGPRCLPAAGSVPGVATPLVIWRAATTLAVLAAAGCVLPLAPPRAVGPLTRQVARALLAALGVRHRLHGRVPSGRALLVANHISWLDVLVLLAYAPVRLLAKREIRGWPVIGGLARAMGVIFIDRSRPRRLPAVVAEVRAALHAGALVAVFAEGTTWCGGAMGRFRPALFQAAVEARVPVVPVGLRFTLAGAGQATTVAAFVGEESLLASVRRVLRARGLAVTVRAHPAVYPGDGADRRALARMAGVIVSGRRRPDPQPSACVIGTNQRRRSPGSDRDPRIITVVIERRGAP